MARTAAFMLAVASGVTAAGTNPAAAEEVYDLLFKTGTLDSLSRASVLTYERDVAFKRDEELGKRNSGTVQLSFVPQDMAELRFLQGEKFRKIGQFPATVGNPMIMYFVETVIRDMAGTAGGSPYYIRNRVKASLLEDVPVTPTTVTYQGRDLPARSITLHPFKNDPNRARMQGFGDLALTVTVSDQVPGWYHSLTAKTGDEAETPVYVSSLTLETLEAGK